MADWCLGAGRLCRPDPFGDGDGPGRGLGGGAGQREVLSHLNVTDGAC